MKLYSLHNLVTLTKVTADEGMPAWANFECSPKKIPLDMREELSGAGIYACFWKGSLIYIGSYAGLPNNPFGGSIVERMKNHIIAFTLRAKALCFRPTRLDAIIGTLDHPIAGDLKAARSAGKRVMRGGMSSYNKARFAAQNWDELHDATPEYLQNNFTFFYRRLPQPSITLTKAQIKKSWLKNIERDLIQFFEPICNTEFRTAEDGPLADYTKVKKEFDNAFAKYGAEPSIKMEICESAAAGKIVANPVETEENEDEENDCTIPEDDRWIEYTTPKGQLRVRNNAPNKGRVLLVRAARNTFHCLASTKRLALEGIDGRPTNQAPLKSIVFVDFDAPQDERDARLTAILNASLAELNGEEIAEIAA